MNKTKDIIIAETLPEQDIDNNELLDEDKQIFMLREPVSNFKIGILWTLSFAGCGAISLFNRNFITFIWCGAFSVPGILIIISYMNFRILGGKNGFEYRNMLRKRREFLFSEVEWFREKEDYWEFKMPDKKISLTINVEGIEKFAYKFPPDKKIL